MPVTDQSKLPGIPAWPIMDDATHDAFTRMMADGSWGRYNGPHCETLISALREYHGVEHVVLCSSGTCAIELALRAIPVTAGDEVILAAYDFKANFINVLATGCVPVLIDTVDGYPIPDVTQIDAAITDRTRAIIVSHLHGNLVPMREVCRLAAERKIAVIEDACQSPGALIGGQRAGTLGDIGVLSFGGSKLLTSGRGGAVITSNAQMAQRIRLYTQRGNESYPLSEMQAAVLLPQLLQLDVRNQQRHERLLQLLNAIGISPRSNLPPLRLPTAVDSTSQMQSAMNLRDDVAAGDNQPAYYKAAFLMPERFTESQRATFCDAARSAGVPIDPGFSGLHKIHSKQRFRSIGDLNNASSLHQRMVTLHHTALLSSEETIQQIGEILGKRI